MSRLRRIVLDIQCLAFGSTFSTSRKSHNTLCLPPKILHNDCIRFLLGREDDPREIENNGYTNFWGVKEVYYGICESRE